MGDGISYTWAVKPELDGMDKANAQLRAGATGLKDLDAATRGASAEMKHLKGGMNGMKPPPEFHRMKQDLHDHEEGFKGVGHAIEHTHSRLVGFLEFAGIMFAIEAVHRLAEGIFDVGAEIVHAAAQAERLDLSLQLTAGVEGGKEINDWIERIASKTEFTEDKLKGWAGALLNAGVKGSEVDKILAASLDIAAKSPDKMAGMERAIDALARSQITGKISTRQLVGLNIGVEQIKTLPEFKGLSQAELSKKIEQGSIKTEQLLQLVAGADKQLGDLGIQAGGTLEAKIKNVQQLPELFFQKFKDSPSFPIFKDKLDQIFESLNPESPHGKVIFASFERTLGSIVDLIAEIDFEQVALTLENDVFPAIRDIAAEIKPVAEAALQTAHGFATMAHWASAVVESLGGAKAAVQGLMNPFQAGKNLFETAIHPERATGIGKLLMKALGKEASAGLAGGLSEGKGPVTSASESLAMSSADAVQSSLDIHSPSRVFEELGFQTAAGFAKGQARGEGMVDASSSGLVAPRLGGSFGGGRRGLSIGPITVEVTGHGDAREQGAAAGDEFVRVIRSKLAALADEDGQDGEEAA